ncbi:MAG: hypothetical protein M3Q14_01680 [bacterium]|nr:hypothetical protein [bacterium]
MTAERNPFTPFESDKEPVKSGEKKMPKKKKTTRVPKSVMPVASEEKTTQKPEDAPLDSLFEKKEDKQEPRIKKSSRFKRVPKLSEEVETTEVPTEQQNIETPQSVLPPLETTTEETIIPSQEDKPKRKRGRPPKNRQAVEETINETETPVVEGELEAEEPIKIEHEESVAETFAEENETKVPLKVGETEGDDMTTQEVAPTADISAETPAIEDTPDTRYYETIPTEPITSERRHVLDMDSTEEANRPSLRHARESEDNVSRSELEHEVYRAEKRGLSRGVVSGGIVGWWIGRRGKREAIDQTQKGIEKQNSVIKQLRAEQTDTVERLNRLKKAPEQAPPPFLPPIAPKETAPIVANETPARQGAAPTKPFMPFQPEAMPFAHQPEAPNPILHAAAAAESAPVLQAPEAIVAPVSFERAPYPFEKPASFEPLAKAEPMPKPEELAPEDKPISEQIYQTPDDRRVETSAWHRVEVDKKTGHAVENPSVEYGEEFRQEQKQERLQREAAEPQFAAQVGSTIINTDTSDVQSSDSQSSQTKPQEKSKTKAMMEALSDTNYVKDELKQRTMQPTTWLMAFGVVVLLFLVGVLQ